MNFAKRAEQNAESEAKTKKGGNAEKDGFRPTERSKQSNRTQTEEPEQGSEEVSDLFKDLEKSELSEFMFEMSEKKTNGESQQVKSQPNIEYLGSLSNNINQVIFKYNSFHFPGDLKAKSFKEEAEPASKDTLNDSLIRFTSMNTNKKNMFNNMSCVNIINHSDEAKPAEAKESDGSSGHKVEAVGDSIALSRQLQLGPKSANRKSHRLKPPLKDKKMMRRERKHSFHQKKKKHKKSFLKKQQKSEKAKGYKEKLNNTNRSIKLDKKPAGEDFGRLTVPFKLSSKYHFKK